MKKFTLLITFFMIAFMTTSQNNQNLKSKIQKINEKYLKFSEIMKYAESNSSNQALLLKSNVASKTLDSIVAQTLNLITDAWENDYKDEYFYDSGLKNTSWREKYWNLTTKGWDTESKTELGYNNQGMVNSLLYYSRNDDYTLLTPESKMLIFYNVAGLQDSVLTYASIDGSTWKLDAKQIHHYNSSKQLIKTEIWAFDEDLVELVLGMNIVYTYTETGKIKSSTTNFLSDGDEMPFSKVDYNYDGAGRLTSMVSSILSFETFMMENSYRYTYQYNSSGRVIVETNSSWENGNWIDNDKTESEYNAEGDVAVETNSIWNGAAWLLDEKDEYQYSSQNFSDVIFPNFYMLSDMIDAVELTFNKLIIGTKTYDMIDGNWKNTGKSTLYFSSGTSTNISELNNSLFAVYPNPAAESVSFSWKGNYENLTLELYQVTGARVKEQITSSGKSVSISNLENGVYLFKLMDGQQSMKTGKLIKN